MPMLNVSPALTNPYTLDTFNVIRRAEQVGSNGRASSISVAINGLRGVVTPGADGEFERTEDYTLQNKWLTIKTLFFLQAESVDGTPQAWQPDIVVWHGNNFIVKGILDWSTYAAGFVKAVCELFDFTSRPPTVTVPAPITPSYQMQIYTLTAIAPGIYTLPYVPSNPQGVPVWYDGVLQKYQINFTIAGNTLTLNFTPETGASVAVFM